MVLPIGSLTDRLVTLEHLGRDDRLGLQVGDLVEVMNNDYALRGSAGTLLEVEEIDTGNLRVTLNAAPDPALGEDTTEHPLLRRWDHGSSSARDDELELQDGAIPLEEGVWIDLEDGVQVLFQPATDEGTPNAYRAGDYWLIPARTATGDVEWPGALGQPEARPPHGVEHHYAPLAVVDPAKSPRRSTAAARSTRLVTTRWISKIRGSSGGAPG